MRATIDLAHDLELRVVAEGVECGAAYQHLRALSCDAAQGYFIAAAELVGWLRSWTPTRPLASG